MILLLSVVAALLCRVRVRPFVRLSLLYVFLLSLHLCFYLSSVNVCLVSYTFFSASIVHIIIVVIYK